MLFRCAENLPRSSQSLVVKAPQTSWCLLCQVSDVVSVRTSIEQCQNTCETACGVAFQLLEFWFSGFYTLNSMRPLLKLFWSLLMLRFAIIYMSFSSRKPRVCVGDVLPVCFACSAANSRFAFSLFAPNSSPGKGMGFISQFLYHVLVSS